NEALSIVCNDGYKGFCAVLHLEKNLPAVQCNYNQVQKALLNLFRNAVEAMRAVNLPTLTIETAVTMSAVQTVAGANVALVTIQDSGPGLDQAMAKRIFEPFFTTKPTGVGMGLEISRALIEANGGQLWVDPGAKSGAKFHFTLPLALDHA
ncbi:MAG: PAS domain-containing sensor histidine kinase, partial [Nitrosomonas sp.]|nr:PAS domain-containing sensor histidine kinase [Nitrosomonas sp.]